MQRQSFWRRYARLVAFQRAARNQSAMRGDTTGTISPILVYTAVALFLILAIIEIDLHREELRALGLIATD
jgi:uncharacterized membrane protein YidH (DUF202 family)